VFKGWAYIKKNVMLVPVGVSTGGHIKKIGTRVLVEDGHIKKKKINARRFSFVKH
jgi:hypothetical protein